MGFLALGGEEKRAVLMLQIYDAQTYYTAHAPSVMVAPSTRSKRWPHPIIIVNDPCLFLVLYSNLVFLFVYTWRWVEPSCYCDDDVQFRLSSFLSEEWCPLERLHCLAAHMPPLDAYSSNIGTGANRHTNPGHAACYNVPGKVGLLRSHPNTVHNRSRWTPHIRGLDRYRV
ncbi:hypothetical protein BJV77DRAFT_411178 [Russula vinacea]|nr:hypothetical protein BJV77DRAFT_411178 [Russula vinacea]